MRLASCPNIELEIDIMDKSPFFIRPYHVKEEDKALIDKEMKWLCYLGILKEGFSAYSSPVMLISRKLYKRQRSSDRFQTSKCKNSKEQLGISDYLKDMFSVLGCSKYEILSVLDLKDAFHSWRLSEHSKEYYGILPYFGSASYL